MHKENGKFYVDCSACGKEYEVGKNTYYKISDRRVCLHCRVRVQNANPNLRGKSKIAIYVCCECGREFAMSIKRYEKRLREYGCSICTSCSKKGERNPFFGQEFSCQQKELLSGIRKGYYDDPIEGVQRRKLVSQHTSGEKNPMYKGAEYASDFTWRDKYAREKVLKRDRCECCVCHRVFPENELIVHHLDGCNWNKPGRKAQNNMVTICDTDHKLFHHIYGYGDNTKAQFEEFLLKRFRDYPGRE